jgi:hypothetical protein
LSVFPGCGALVTPAATLQISRPLPAVNAQDIARDSVAAENDKQAHTFGTPWLLLRANLAVSTPRNRAVARTADAPASGTPRKRAPAAAAFIPASHVMQGNSPRKASGGRPAPVSTTARAARHAPYPPASQSPSSGEQDPRAQRVLEPATCGPVWIPQADSIGDVLEVRTGAMACAGVGVRELLGDAPLLLLHARACPLMWRGNAQPAQPVTVQIIFLHDDGYRERAHVVGARLEAERTAFRAALARCTGYSAMRPAGTVGARDTHDLDGTCSARDMVLAGTIVAGTSFDALALAVARFFAEEMVDPDTLVVRAPHGGADLLSCIRFDDVFLHSLRCVRGRWVFFMYYRAGP